MSSDNVIPIGGKDPSGPSFESKWTELRTQVNLLQCVVIAFNHAEDEGEITGEVAPGAVRALEKIANDLDQITAEY